MPLAATIGATTIFIDTPHQILVNKLCALLGRSEPRDVEDIYVLLQNGGDLERALRDFPVLEPHGRHACRVIQ